MMVAHVHEKTYQDGTTRKVTAVCDRALLGKTFKQGERVLDLKAYRRFYEGQRVNEGEACTLLAQARSVNAVGEKSVACALKTLPIDPDAVVRIQGIPHIQVYYL
ncbi:MAG: DUF424 family protein [Candidatus Micrarchaeota archaeon]|nr:DUF424 family protein [Candidatus Micrarchaeota archaeon]